MKEDNNGLNNLERSKDTNNTGINPTGIMAEMERLEKEAEKSRLSDFEHLRITAEKDIPVNEPVITMGGKGIAAKRNLTGISAQYKAGKTAFVSVIEAGAVSPGNEPIDGFNELYVEPNPEGKAVIDIDTEQAEDDQQYKIKTILKRCNLETTPDYFLSYNFRLLSIEDYQNTLTPICQAANKEFGGIHLIVIDGGADFLHSVNDEAESVLIREYFTHLSTTYDCPVLIVVHQNPNSDKERGHFGSEIQRKCYGLISISKQNDISTAIVKAGRKAGTTDAPMISYRYDETKGYHIETDVPDENVQKRANDMERHRDLAIEVFSGQKAMSYTEAYMAIMQASKRKERTAKEIIRNMVGWDFIVKGEDNNYRISAKVQSSAKRCKNAPT